MTLDSVLVVSDDVVTQELENEMVLLSLDRAEYFGLNATGTLVWKALVNGQRLRDVSSVLALKFSVDIERARADVSTLAQQLIDAGLASTKGA